MIVDLPDTTTSAVSKKIMSLREQGGVIALGRVLTLVVVTKSGLEEEAIEAANEASREHPCRIIVLADAGATAPDRLDAQIRVGGDAGASEVIILHGYGELAEPTETLISALLLPDAPIVAWWPHDFPDSPGDSSIGKIAHRRITDSARADDPFKSLQQLSQQYRPGDTDLAWTRITSWRIQLAAVFDQIGAVPVREVIVEGAERSPSVVLMGVWLANALGCEAKFITQTERPGMDRVTLVTDDGPIELHRPGNTVAVLKQPGQPDQQIAMPVRDLNVCLAEELRRLDPDEVYGDVITKAMVSAELEEAVEDAMDGEESQ